MNLNDLFTEEKVRLDPKCWTGKKIGNPKTKMKGGTRVNNCVPAESVNEMDKSQTPPGRDGSNDSDAGKKEYTAKATTAKKVAKDAEKILNKELNKKQGVAEGDLDEGWKEKLGGAALAGAMALGSTGANARVTPDGQGGFTGGFKPSATVTAPADNKQAAEAPKGFSKEYLQSVIDGKHPRPMVSVEKAKELLKNMQEGDLNEKSTSQAQFRTMAAAAHNPEFAKKVGISQDVAKEFHSADKNSNYKKLPDRTNEEGERGRGRPMAGDWDPTSGKVGRVEKTPTGVRHYADPSRYGGTENDPELDRLDKGAVNKMDNALGVKWDRESKRYFSPIKVDETKPKEKEADYGDDYQDMVARVKKLAGLGPLKTVYDPAKRVYRNVPTAQQPKK